MAKERNLVYDAIKLFAILMVLWGHAVAYLQTSDPTENPVFIAIYSFHMPLFMTVVGFFSGSVAEKRFSDFITIKARQLLLPPLVIGGFLAVGVWLKSGPSIALNSIISSYWFLKSAFLCFLIYYVGTKVESWRWLGIVFSLVVSLCITDFGVDRLYPYFLLGILLRTYQSYLKVKAGMIAICSGAVFILMLPHFNSEILVARCLAAFKTAINEHEYAGLYCYLFRFVIGLAGSLFFISLFEYLSMKITAGKYGRMIAAWGAETLGVYLFQTILLELPPKYIGHIDGMNPKVYNFIVTPAVSLGVLGISLLLIDLIKRNRWLSFFVLGKRLDVRDEKKQKSHYFDAESSQV